jgi:hypothetical protein
MVTAPRRLTLALTALALAASAPACGGKQTEPEPPPYSLDDEGDDPDDGMTMQQEFGGMNEEKVNKAVEALYPALTRCLLTGQKRIDFLGGEVAFLVKVNTSGRAEAAHAERSTLGDFQAERCMLAELSASRWPKPVGGRIGLARTSIVFDPPADVRPPVEWSASDVASTLEAEGDALASCGRGGPFTVTAYIDTDGRVLGAGVAHADDSGEETAACLAGAVERIRFPSPGSWPAKVTFER